MKYWPGGSYLFMEINTRVPGVRPLITIVYKYNSRKVLGFIANDEAGSNEPGDHYLSNLPDIYSNVSFIPIVCTHFIGSYLNACNAIDNNNRIHKSDLALDKYWVTQNGYFRLATTVKLGMGNTDGSILFCHGVSEGSVDN